MRREEIIARLKQTEPAIRALGADALYLYGSDCELGERVEDHKGW